MERISAILIFIMILAGSCKKDKVEPDYRDKFTGNYSFCINYIHTLVDASNYPQIKIYSIDTSYSYDGSVVKSDEAFNKVLVDWGNDEMKMTTEGVYTQKSSIIIDSAGNLTTPGKWHLGNIKEDSINFSIWNENGMAGMLYSIWKVKGIKKN